MFDDLAKAVGNPFSTLVLEAPCPAHFSAFPAPNVTPRPPVPHINELKCAGQGASRTRAEKHCYKHLLSASYFSLVASVQK